MSQWGATRTVNGATFVPHVETSPFDPATGGDIVDDVLLLGDGGDKDLAMRTLEELRSKFLGQPYSAWLSPNVELRGAAQ